MALKRSYGDSFSSKLEKGFHYTCTMLTKYGPIVTRDLIFARPEACTYSLEIIFANCLILFYKLSLHHKSLLRILYSRLCGLANFLENVVLANKKCFTVYDTYQFRHNKNCMCFDFYSLKNRYI